MKKEKEFLWHLIPQLWRQYLVCSFHEVRLSQHKHVDLIGVKTNCL